MDVSGSSCECCSEPLRNGHESFALSYQPWFRPHAAPRLQRIAAAYRRAGRDAAGTHVLNGLPGRFNVLTAMFGSVMLFVVVWTPVLVQGQMTKDVSITISYADCAQNGNAPSRPTVSATDFSGNVALQQTLPQSPRRPVRTIEFSLHPGFYGVGVRDGACSASIALTVLPGHPRAIAVIGDTLFHMRDPSGMLSGTLPSTGWRVAIVYPDRAAIQGLGSDSDGNLEMGAVVEGNAYYATSLRAGRVIIRLYNQARDQCLDFDGGVIDLSPGGHTARIRNITPDDLRSAINSDPSTLCIRKQRK